MTSELFPLGLGRLEVCEWGVTVLELIDLSEIVGDGECSIVAGVCVFSRDELTACEEKSLYAVDGVVDPALGDSS